jgi:hypothetical protein
MGTLRQEENAEHNTQSFITGNKKSFSKLHSKIIKQKKQAVINSSQNL